MPTYIPVIVSILLACVPVIVWSRLLLRKTPLQKRSLIAIFIGGSLSVFPIFFLQWLWTKYPTFNVIEQIGAHVTDPKQAALLVFIFVGIMEEVVKQSVVRITDRRNPELIQTINATLTFSITSALGFAFAENIFYFYNIWVNLGVVDLFSSFVFRSIFTAAGHMTFSGIFGYYFGIAKFSSDITSEERYEGKKFYVTKFLGKIFGWKTYEAFRQQKILTGLLLAMGIHAVFNFFLELNHILPVILLIAASGTYVYYLMHRISGQLVFSYGSHKEATIGMRDEEVVIELLGMWTQEGKYQEVIDICGKLLERDPDNNVVKLFRTKAADNQKLRGFYESLKEMFKKSAVAGPSLPTDMPSLDAKREQVVAEVLDMWYENGNYQQVVEVAQKLLARNPTSEGAKLILKKALDKEKLEKVFHSLQLLFEGPPQKV